MLLGHLLALTMSILDFWHGVEENAEDPILFSTMLEHHWEKLKLEPIVDMIHKKKEEESWTEFVTQLTLGSSVIYKYAALIKKKKKQYRFIKKGFTNRVVITFNLLREPEPNASHDGGGDGAAMGEADRPAGGRAALLLERALQFRTLRDVAMNELLPDDYVLDSLVDPASSAADSSSGSRSSSSSGGGVGRGGRTRS